MSPSVYVVTALYEWRVKEQYVYAKLDDANEKFDELVVIYGGASVSLTSREVK
jgi:hypothetical protein